MMIAKYKDVEIEYSEEYVKKVRQYFNKSEMDEITDQHIVDFFLASLNSGIQKGYALYE